MNPTDAQNIILSCMAIGAVIEVGVIIGMIYFYWVKIHESKGKK